MQVLISKQRQLLLDEVFQQISEQKSSNPDQSIFLIVPEQRKLWLEAQLMKALPQKALLHVELLSVSRFFYRLQGELGQRRRAISSELASLLLYRALHTQEEPSEAFGRATREMGFVQKLLEQINELRRFRVRPAQLIEAAKFLEEDAKNRPAAQKLFAKKARELGRYLEAYEAELKEYALQDAVSQTDEMLDRLRYFQGLLQEEQGNENALSFPYKHLTFLTQAQIYVLGFGENRPFSPQELELLLLLEELCQSVTLTVTGDESVLAQMMGKKIRDEQMPKENEGASSHKKRIFRPAYDVAEYLERCGVKRELRYLREKSSGEKRACGTDLHKKVAVNGSSFEVLGELVHSDFEIGDPIQKAKHMAELMPKLRLIRASQSQTELELIAGEILRLNRVLKIPYREIVVALNIQDEKESDEIKRVFERYGLPFYFENRACLSTTPLFEYVRQLLALAAYGFKRELVFELLRYTLDTKEVLALDHFERYTLERNMDAHRFFSDLRYVDDPRDLASADIEELKNKERQSQETKRALAFRETYLRPLRNLCLKLMEQKTLRDLAWTLLEHFKEIQIEDRVKKASLSLRVTQASLSAIPVQSWNHLVSLLADCVRYGRDLSCDTKQLRHILTEIFQNSVAQRLPNGLDQVLISTPERIAQREYSVLFIAKMEVDRFPYYEAREALLSQRERRYVQTFANLGLDDIEARQMDNCNHIAWRLLTSNKDRLYLSYGGNKDLRSGYFEHLEGMIQSLSEQEDLDPKIRERLNLEHITLTENQGAAFCLHREKLSDVALFHRVRALCYDADAIDGAEADLKYEALYRFFIQQRLRSGLQEGQSLMHLMAALEGQNARRRQVTHQVHRELLKLVLPEPLRLSTTAMETYQSCPQRYFFERILKLKKRETQELDQRSTGTIVHALLQTFFDAQLAKGLLEKGVHAAFEQLDVAMKQSIEASGIEELLAAAKKRLIPYSYFERGSFAEKGLPAMNLYQKTLIRMRWKLWEDWLSEEQVFYRPLKNELNTGDRSQLALIQSPMGKEISLNAKIDRVDQKIKTNGVISGLRILDYKTGNKEVRVTRMLEGLDLQLPFYAVAYEAALDAGANASTRLESDSEANVLAAPIEELSYVQLKPSSFEFPQDVKPVLDRMQKWMEDSSLPLDRAKAEVLKDDLKAWKNVNKSNGKTKFETRVPLKEDAEDLRTLIHYARIKIGETADSILEGDFGAKPIMGETACQYCEARLLCRIKNDYDASARRPRREDEKEAWEIISAEVIEKVGTEAGIEVGDEE